MSIISWSWLVSNQAAAASIYALLPLAVPLVVRNLHLTAHTDSSGTCKKMNSNTLYRTTDPLQKNPTAWTPKSAVSGHTDPTAAFWPFPWLSTARARRGSHHPLHASGLPACPTPCRGQEKPSENRGQKAGPSHGDASRQGAGPSREWGKGLCSAPWLIADGSCGQGLSHAADSRVEFVVHRRSLPPPPSTSATSASPSPLSKVFRHFLRRQRRHAPRPGIVGAERGGSERRTLPVAILIPWFGCVGWAGDVSQLFLDPFCSTEMST